MTKTLAFLSATTIGLLLTVACDDEPSAAESTPAGEVAEPVAAVPEETMPEETTPDEPPAQAEASDDLAGEWTATLMHESVSGPCPTTPTQTGPMTLSRPGGEWTMQLGEGFTCSPASACVFAGSEGEGGALSLTNAGPADDEGGHYTTELELREADDGTLAADGVSHYRITGMECRWTTTLTASRGGA